MRSFIEMSMDILEITKCNMKTTEIMRKSNINGTSFNEKFSNLIKQGLVLQTKCEHDKRSHWLYSLSKDGGIILNDYRSLCDRLGVKQ